MKKVIAPISQVSVIKYYSFVCIRVHSSVQGELRLRKRRCPGVFVVQLYV